MAGIPGCTHVVIVGADAFFCAFYLRNGAVVSFSFCPWVVCFVGLILFPVFVRVASPSSVCSKQFVVVCACEEGGSPWVST